MEGNGVIKESELIQFDGSTQKLIESLESLSKTMQEVSSIVKQSAGSVAGSVREVNVLTNSGKQKLEEAAVAAERFATAQKGLESALASAAKTMAQVKTETGKANKVSAEQTAVMEHAMGSYKAMEQELKALKDRWRSMSAEERESSDYAKVTLDRIAHLTTNLKALDAQMRKHIASVNAEALQQAKLGASTKGTVVGTRELSEAERMLTQNAETARVAEGGLNQEIMTKALETAKANASTKEMNRIMALEAQVVNNAAGSYNNIAAQYRLLKIAIQKMQPMNEKQRRDYIAMANAAMEYHKQMVRIQADMGEHSLNVGNYRSAWNGLGMSVNQIVRELPSAAMSLNTFFVAISNNIPILMDEITKMRQKNKVLQEQGLKTVSIGKSIVKALLSWNSAIVLLVTGLAMFGGKIVETIRDITSLGNAVKLATRATKALNKELGTSNDSYGEHLVQFRKLAKAYRNLEGEQEQEAFIAGEAKDEIEELNLAINDNNDAQDLFINRTDDVIKAFKLRARAAAAYHLAQLEFEKALVSEVKGDRLLKKSAEGLSGKKFIPNDIGLFKGLFTGETKAFYQGIFGGYQKARQDQSETKAEMYEKIMEDAIKDIEELDVFQETEDTKNEKKARSKKLRDLAERIMKMRLDAEKKYQDSFLAIQEEGYDKQRMALITANEQKNDELTKTYNQNLEWLKGSGTKYAKLTDEQIEAINQANQEILATIENNDKEFAEALKKLAIEQQISRIETEEHATELQLETIRKGSQEELDLRIRLIRYNMYKELEENKLLAKEKQQAEDVIRAKYSKEAFLAEGSFTMERYEEAQELERELFEVTKKSTYATNKFRIDQERDLIKKQLELAKKGQLDLTEIEIETLKAALLGLDEEMTELNRDWTPKGILSRLGFDDKAIDALTQATKYVIDQYGAILNAEEELREKQLSASRERVSAAQSAYEAEVEARNNGYANNVLTAKKELMLAKQQQRDKEALLKQAQVRTQRLESVMQATSLTTASAELWKSLAGIPVVGPALALAAIGTMWGSFTAAKIKAKQVTSVQEYGEGGFEMLEGGSHASGHDIDLGVKNRRGKRMRVEGGEALAVFNKRQTQHYGKLLPEIVKSINKGVFEERFLQSFPNIQPQVVVSPSTVDLARIEQSLADIQKQNETKIIGLADGTLIKVNKNITTTIHA